jgi:subtilase-type serine protease
LNTVQVKNDAGKEAIAGLSFYTTNAVMYDLQNTAIGYTPFYVTAASFTNGLAVSQDMGPFGVAGVISGANGVTINPNGIAYMTAANTYTGATTVAQAGWLGVGGPGSIAASSNVGVDGTLDLFHSSNAQSIRPLSGGGAVVLGPTTLVLTAASGTFSGGIYNTYAAGGAEPYPLPTDSPQGYGGVIIAGGVETFSGDNGYAGATGIGEAGRLILTGTLENSAVLNAGYFQNNGLVRGMTTSTGTVGGNGNFAGGLFAASGVVAPGDPRLGTPGHLTVGTGFALGSDTTYLVRSAGANASRIDVEGGRRSRARRSTRSSVRPRNSPSSDKTLPCSPPRTVSSASSAPSTPTWERQRRSFPS